jgi:hypothetical protein
MAQKTETRVAAASSATTENSQPINEAQGGMAPVIDLSDARFRRLVEHLCLLGPRAVHEFFLEITAEHTLYIAIETKLRRYRLLPPEALRSLGGDDL